MCTTASNSTAGVGFTCNANRYYQPASLGPPSLSTADTCTRMCLHKNGLVGLRSPVACDLTHTSRWPATALTHSMNILRSVCAHTHIHTHIKRTHTHTHARANINTRTHTHTQGHVSAVSSALAVVASYLSLPHTHSPQTNRSVHGHRQQQQRCFGVHERRKLSREYCWRVPVQSFLLAQHRRPGRRLLSYV